MATGLILARADSRLRTRLLVNTASWIEALATSHSRRTSYQRRASEQCGTTMNWRRLTNNRAGRTLDHMNRRTRRCEAKVRSGDWRTENRISRRTCGSKAEIRSRDRWTINWICRRTCRRQHRTSGCHLTRIDRCGGTCRQLSVWTSSQGGRWRTSWRQHRTNQGIRRT